MCQNKQLKKTQIRQKGFKVGTLSLASRVARAPIIFLMLITTSRYDVATKKDFTKKYQKLAEIFSKILDFMYTTSPIMVTWQAFKANKVLKIVLKVVQEDFCNTCKKSYWLHLPFFSQMFWRLGVWNHPRCH